MNLTPEQLAGAELSDEELDIVTGGNQTVDGINFYSSNPPYYFITSANGSCDGFTGWCGGFSCCGDCQHVERIGYMHYCTVRTLDNDPYKNNH